MSGIEAPRALAPADRLDSFSCGEPTLDRWLKERARRNETEGATRCLVICSDGAVVGYYALAAGAVSHVDAPGRVRRNMPEPVPVVVLARLAIDSNWQGRDLGRALLRDSVRRVVAAADIVGVRAILVHALTERAKPFYERFGFSVSPVHPLTLMITLADARRAL
ncbi:MAG: GNAT family N-acetyltransferase [Reyranellaceae bacterium]